MDAAAQRGLIERATSVEGFAALLIALRPLCLRKVQKDYRMLSHVHDEILGAVEDRLLRWCLDPSGRGRLSLDESLSELARRLVQQEALPFETEARRRTMTELKDDRVEPATAEAKMEASLVMAVILALPPPHGEVLKACAIEERDGHPPLHDALGLSPNAAAQRLRRARIALAEKLNEFEKGSEDVEAYLAE